MPPPRIDIAILGAGNIGRAMARGWTAAGLYGPEQVILTRRNVAQLDDLAQQLFHTTDDNRAAVQVADIVCVAVEPHQLDGVLQDIAPELDPQRHMLVSVVSGASVDAMAQHLPPGLAVVRAMPNTAIAIGESMTCLASRAPAETMERARKLFDAVGSTLVIDEELMVPATALCACGIAFFLRSVRAASQGGIEIGFHPKDALRMAAQTARGAAGLVLREGGGHPEREIDSVTTPRGCTIAGLNEMEHQGFSSSLIRGIVTSATKAGALYSKED